MITSISSAKTGMGKTFFAISLASALSILKQKTLFFDADLGSFNINEQLGLELSNNFLSVLIGDKILNQVITYCNKPSFDIISNQAGILKLEQVPEGVVDILLKDLQIISQNYHYTIIDTANNFETPHKYAQKMIILCNDEPSSIANCFEIIKKNLSFEINIVINFANSLIDAQRTFATLEKACFEFLNFSPKFLGMIRKDSRIRDAVRNKSCIINRYPQSEASQDILQIAQRLINNG